MEIPNTVKTVLNGEKACAIIVNAHGKENTGIFYDSFFKVDVSPHLFWCGGELPCCRWSGLDRVLAETGYNHGKPIFIVFAQCYGLHFSDAVKEIIQNERDNVIIHGCSSGPTFSHPRNQIHMEMAEILKTLTKTLRLFEQAI